MRRDGDKVHSSSTQPTELTANYLLPRQPPIRSPNTFALVDDLVDGPSVRCRQDGCVSGSGQSSAAADTVDPPPELTFAATTSAPTAPHSPRTPVGRRTRA